MPAMTQTQWVALERWAEKEAAASIGAEDPALGLYHERRLVGAILAMTKVFPDEKGRLRTLLDRLLR